MLKNQRMTTIRVALVVLLMIALSIPCMMQEVYGQTAIPVTNEAELTSAIADATAETDIQIQNDIVLSKMLEIPKGKQINLSGKTGKEELTISLKSYESAQKSDTQALASVEGDISVENLTFNGGNNLRVMYIGAGGNVELNQGAVITGGNLGKKSINWGAGIRLEGSRTKKANLTINDGAVIKDSTAAGDACITGVGICIYKYGDVVMNGGKITGSKDLTTGSSRYFSYGGGLALIGADSNFTMNGGEISDCNAKASGGGVYIATGTDSFIMNGGAIKNNTTTASGGGLYISGASGVMNGGTISGNKAESNTTHGYYASGGGVYIAGGSENDGSTSGSMATFTMKKGTICNNTANSTATSNPYDAQFGQGGGALVGGKFYMEGGSITGNKAISSKDLGGSSACGGAVSIKGGSCTGTFTMTGGSITNNQAKNQGGGVYFNTKDLESTMFNTSLDSVVQTKGIGNFIVQGDVTVKDNINLSSCQSNIYLPENAYLTISDELDQNADLYLECADAVAGRVVAKAGEDYTITAQDARKLKSNDGDRVYDISKGKLIYTGTKAESYTDISTAVVSGLKASYEYTGTKIMPEPVVILDGNVLECGTDYTVSYTMKSCDNVNVSANGKSGVVKIVGAGNYEGTIIKNFTITAREIKDVHFDAIAERIYVENAVVEPKVHGNLDGVILSEGTDYSLSYSNNTKPGTGTVTITGIGKFKGTTDVTFKIIENSGLTLAFDEADLKKAIEDAKGAASAQKIYIMDSIQVKEAIVVPEGANVDFIGNGDTITISASASMTNLMEVDGTAKVESLTLDGGKKGRVMLIESSGKVEIAGNAAITGGWAGIGTSDVNDSGSGIYNKGSLVLSAGEIYQNQGRNGAAIFNVGTLLASNTVLHDNTALMGGGAIYNAGNATLNEGTVIKDNLADASVAYVVGVSGAGGGIYNAGKLTCGEGCRIEENTADYYGGGIYTEKEAIVTGASITGNITSGKTYGRVVNCGGGVYVAAGKFQMDKGDITGNIAKSTYVAKSPGGSLGNGGGVYVANHKTGTIFVMNGGSISGNQASSLIESKYSGNGGGVFLLGGDYHEDPNNEITPASFSLKDGVITGNSASGSGDGIFASNEEAYVEYKTSHGYDGEVLLSFAGTARVYDNEEDDLYLRKNVVISLTDSVEGGAVGVTAEEGGTVAIAQGTGYDVTAKDAAIFSNRTGARTVQFANGKQIVLEAIDIANEFSVKFDESSFVYTGVEIKPQVKVTSESGVTLKEGVDYTVSYEGSGVVGKKLINVGEKTAIVSGTGDYTGFIEGAYEIVSRDISDVNATVASQTYTGSAITPVLSSIAYNGVSLLRGSEYTLSYSDNVNAGTAKVMITGKSNFHGTKTLTFKISPYKISNTSVSSISTKVYTGKSQKPVPTVKHGSKKLTNGKDYSITYKNNKNTGKATVTITGKGNYTGTKTVSFKIIPKKATVSSVTSSKKGQLTVKCKKDTQASGYQMVVAQNSAFTKGKKSVVMTKNSTVAKTFTKLTSKRTYYVKVRSYKNISGTKYYGAYSTVKKIKVK